MPPSQHLQISECQTSVKPWNSPDLNGPPGSAPLSQLSRPIASQFYPQSWTPPSGHLGRRPQNKHSLNGPPGSASLSQLSHPIASQLRTLANSRARSNDKRDSRMPIRKISNSAARARPKRNTNTLFRSK